MESLEELLTKAKAGEFKGFAFAAEVSKGRVFHMYKVSEGGSVFALLGAVSVLSFKMNAAFPPSNEGPQSELS